MVEFRYIPYRDTVLFRVGNSGWTAPQMLGMLLTPGTHHVYENGKSIGHIEVFSQEDATVHLIRKQGRVV